MERRQGIVAGKVESNMAVADGVYEMVIATGAMCDYIPGQFINIYLDDKSMLLPRPVSISEAGQKSVALAYKAVGKGTSYLAGYGAGAPVRICGPLGNGYSIEADYSGRRIALVAGGIGIAPMIGLAKALTSRNAAVSAFLGFQSEVFLAGKLEKICGDVFISTDDGGCGFHGNAVEMLQNLGSLYDGYFACGPKPMLKAISEYTAKIERSIQVSIEERMGCGYGACLGCYCKIKDGDGVARRSVCKHGPVFWGKDVIWD